uniref:Uncharacterized protein n=1 Tax=Lactuca sativa TaxID=4236 RepID=A0A9R1XG25_LACSA|nr:hypothetical protein LSAT_V11C500267240 [Lactuca sativa]
MEEDRNEGPPRKRLLTDPNPKKCFVTVSPESTVSSDSSSDRLAKKTRDLPNLSDCHSCAVRINYTNPRERLQPLDSMWRVVLLCKKCTKGVKSSELCPYCFSVVGDDKDYFKCLDCQHSIHKDCVAKFGSGPGFSVCVDCWVPDAVASSIGLGKRKRKKHNKQSCERAATLPESRVSVGEEVGKKFAAAEKASDNALKKSVIAKSAVELVKGVLNVVSNTNLAGSSESKVVDDKNLAFMLHREINSSPRISRYACLMSSFTGDNAQIRCYSRRRASKKTSLMNSGNLGVPLIFYSRRRVKSGLKNSVTSNAPLIFYSRRRSSSKACSHVRECESFIVELSEGMDKHVSVSSSIGLKTSNCGSSAENSSSGNECQENDRVRFSLDPHRFLLKYHRMRKCNPRTSVFVKDSDCGSYIDSADLNAEDTSDTRDFRNGEICEIGDKNANRFLLKYKRSKAPACLAQ